MSSHEEHDHFNPRSLYVAASLTITYAAIEAGAGWWANSLALMSDAGHMLTDAAALLIATLGAWLAQRKPSLRHSYGLLRAEFLAALINSLLMLAVAGWVMAHAIERLYQPLEVRGEAVTGVAFIGLLLNILVLYLLGHGVTDLNRRAAALHVLSDLLSSVIALLSGVIIIFTGWTRIDPLLSILIAVFILYSTLKLLREAVHGLMEGVPLNLSLANIGQSMAERPGVLSVHDLHVWSLSSQKLALSAHIVIDDLLQWDRILDDLSNMLREQHDIGHVTLQPESATRVITFRNPQHTKNTEPPAD